MFPETRHFSVGVVHWALHSLLTHRGHFYNTTPVSQFKPGALNIKEKFLELNQLNQVKSFEFSVANTPEIEHILKDRFTSKKDKINPYKINEQRKLWNYNKQCGNI